MDADKQVGMSRGIALSLLIIGIPMFGWLIGFDYAERSHTEAIGVTLAKISAFGGLAMFAWSLILSGRYRIFDRLFGGQDKTYAAHRLFASLSVALVLIHPIALLIARLPSSGAVNAFTGLFNLTDLGILLGIISLAGLIGFVLWSVTARVKHETFIRVHRLLGIVFIIAVFHALAAGSVLAANDFLWWYTAILSSLAVLSYVHYSFLGDFLHPHIAYKVSSTKRHRGDILEINLRPSYRHLPFTPGQFCYVAFDKLLNSEYHPFTIGSAPRSSTLQLYVRMSGDFTKELVRLRPGDKARIKGAYGGFTFQGKKHHKQLWIAGGIGITPFLSKARSLPKARRWPQIELLYITRTAGDAFAARELSHIEYSTASFNYTLLNANRYGTKSLYDLSEQLGDLSDWAIYLCGPPSMLKAYEQQARRLGLSRQLHFEEFSF